MGWERKRGALTELVRLLKRKPTGLRTEVGEEDWLREVTYVITLDGDTSLNVGTAREMVGAMAHPLNQPVVDGQRPGSSLLDTPSSSREWPWNWRRPTGPFSPVSMVAWGRGPLWLHSQRRVPRSL